MANRDHHRSLESVEEALAYGNALLRAEGLSTLPRGTSPESAWAEPGMVWIDNDIEREAEW